MIALTDVERGVLRLVREGGARASWHWLGKRAPELGFPVPNVMSILKSLQERGLLTRTSTGGGMDRWALTDAGSAALAEAELKGVPEGPLKADELRAFAAALRLGARATVSALQPLINDGARTREALLQVIALDPSTAVMVARASLFLRPADLLPFAEKLLGDPRPEIRAALFQGWAPPRMDVPGEALRTVAPEELDNLLRRALLDPSRQVRATAAAFAFASNRGAGVMGELIANLDAPERDLRCLAILALGSATDPLSLGALEQIAVEPEPAAAAAAVRALAARQDGQRAFLAALADPRGEIQRAACFALAEVARGLSPEELSVLGRDPRPEVREALARYNARAHAIT